MIHDRQDAYPTYRLSFASIMKLFPLSVMVALAAILAGCAGDNKPASNFNTEFQRFQKETNPESAARNLAALALQQKKGADSNGAERSLEAAVKRAAEIKDADGKAQAFNTIASAQGQLGLVGDCRKSLKEVQGAVEKMKGDEARSKMLARMALSYETYLEDANLSKHFFGEAEKVAKKSADVPAQARGLIEVARYLGFAKDAELKAAATRLVAEAKAAAATIKEDRARIDALAEIVVTLEKGGNKAEATASMQEATKAAKSIADPTSRANAFIDLAERAREIGRLSEVTQLFDEARAAAKLVTDPSLKSEVEQRIDLKSKP